MNGMTVEEAERVAVLGDKAEVGMVVEALGVLFEEKRNLEHRLEARGNIVVAMPDRNIGLAVSEVVEELISATKANGPFNSPHEGIGVLDEEFIELKDEAYLKPSKRSKDLMRKEAKQVAAMGIRFMLDCCSTEPVPQTPSDLKAAAC